MKARTTFCPHCEKKGRRGELTPKGRELVEKARETP
jgi:hypothetical protein